MDATGKLLLLLLLLLSLRPPAVSCYSSGGRKPITCLMDI
jgi:hypothetical protein